MFRDGVAIWPMKRPVARNFLKTAMCTSPVILLSLSLKMITSTPWLWNLIGFAGIIRYVNFFYCWCELEVFLLIWCLFSILVHNICLQSDAVLWCTTRNTTVGHLFRFIWKTAGGNFCSFVWNFGSWAFQLLAKMKFFAFNALFLL